MDAGHLTGTGRGELVGERLVDPIQIVLAIEDVDVHPVVAQAVAGHQIIARVHHVDDPLGVIGPVSRNRGLPRVDEPAQPGQQVRDLLSRIRDGDDLRRGLLQPDKRVLEYVVLLVRLPHRVARVDDDLDGVLAGRDVHLIGKPFPIGHDDRFLRSASSEDQRIDELVVEVDFHGERDARPHAAPILHGHSKLHVLPDDQGRIVPGAVVVEYRNGPVRVEGPSRLEVGERQGFRYALGGRGVRVGPGRNRSRVPRERLLEHVVGLVGLFDEVRRIDDHLEGVLAGSQRHERADARPRDHARQAAGYRPVLHSPRHQHPIIVEVHPHGIVDAGKAAILKGRNDV